MIRTRTATTLTALTGAVAVVTTVASADQIPPALDSAYPYPNSSGTELGTATSATLTYLFVIAGTALLASLVYLASRALSRSRAGWWAASALSALGVGIAIFNALQPEIPLAVKLVFFLPPLAGGLWLSAARAERHRAPGADDQKAAAMQRHGTDEQ